MSTRSGKHKVKPDSSPSKEKAKAEDADGNGAAASDGACCDMQRESSGDAKEHGSETKSEVDKQIKELSGQYQKLCEKMFSLYHQRPRVLMSADHEFSHPNNKKVTLSELFGDRDELMVVHNMGKNCSYCSLWADGYSGITDQIESRCGFAVINMDTPADNKFRIAQRKWTFPLLSDVSGQFTKECGFESVQKADIGTCPLKCGISTFSKEENKIYQVAYSTEYGPFDTFSPIWHMFRLLPKGVGTWEPMTNKNK